MVAQTQHVETASGIDELPRAVPLFVAAPKQRCKTVQQLHKLSRLVSCTLHIYSFGDSLVKRTHPTFHLMKHNCQIQTGHACREQCFLHILIVVLDSDNVILEFILYPLLLERMP